VNKQFSLAGQKDIGRLIEMATDRFNMRNLPNLSVQATKTAPPDQIVNVADFISAGIQRQSYLWPEV